MNYFRDVQDIVCVELLFLAWSVPGTYFRGTPTEYNVSYVGLPDCNVLEKLKSGDMKQHECVQLTFCRV